MNVCLDACFIIGLYDERDQHHERSVELFVDLFDSDTRNTAIVVWPVLYEAVSTRLVRHRGRTATMERDWRKLVSSNRLTFMDDDPYRDEAFDLCLRELEKPEQAYRSLSLTDRVLRGVLADMDVRIDAILTFNEKDFSDVCRASRRQVVS
jgi:predicted nucleic acid-binding protein